MNESLKKPLFKMILARLGATVLMLSLITFGGFSLLATPAWSHDVTPHPHAEDSKAEDEYKHPKHGSLGNIGNKLANPMSELWQNPFRTLWLPYIKVKTPVILFRRVPV
jgi:hypothetical protein